MKIKYEAVDGKIFDNKNDCIEYETYIDHQFFLVHVKNGDTHNKNIIVGISIHIDKSHNLISRDLAAKLVSQYLSIKFGISFYFDHEHLKDDLWELDEESTYGEYCIDYNIVKKCFDKCKRGSYSKGYYCSLKNYEYTDITEAIKSMIHTDKSYTISESNIKDMDVPF